MLAYDKGVVPYMALNWTLYEALIAAQYKYNQARSGTYRLDYYNHVSISMCTIESHKALRLDGQQYSSM